MKKLILGLILISACYIMPACNGDSKSTDTTSTTDSLNTSTTSQTNDTGTMVQSNSSMSDTSSAGMSGSNVNKMDTLDKEASAFVMKAASGGMMEVELGNAAQQQAKSQRVKDFGAMMVTDHTKANDELKSIASAKNTTIPAALIPAHQMHVDMIKKKSGADFDKAYIKMMVEDHKKDIADFKKASANVKNEDIKNFASKTLPVLQKHMDSVQAISKSKM